MRLLDGVEGAALLEPADHRRQAAGEHVVFVDTRRGIAAGVRAANDIIGQVGVPVISDPGAAQIDRGRAGTEFITLATRGKRVAAPPTGRPQTHPADRGPLRVSPPAQERQTVTPSTRGEIHMAARRLGPERRGAAGADDQLVEAAAARWLWIWPLAVEQRDGLFAAAGVGDHEPAR